jgi:hypothetical protein
MCWRPEAVRAYSAKSVLGVDSEVDFGQWLILSETWRRMTDVGLGWMMQRCATLKPAISGSRRPHPARHRQVDAIPDVNGFDVSGRTTAPFIILFSGDADADKYVRCDALEDQPVW